MTMLGCSAACAVTLSTRVRSMAEVLIESCLLVCHCTRLDYFDRFAFRGLGLRTFTGGISMSYCFQYIK